MDNYKVLDTSSGGAQVETSRPNVVGTKRELKKEHGSIADMVAKYLRFMVNEWNSDYNTPIHHPNKPDQVIRKSPVEEILDNYRYYQAQQETYPYKYLTETMEGEERPTPYSHGHEIYQVVQHMVGPVVKHFAGTTISIESLDPSTQSIRQSKVAMIEAKKKLPDVFDRFQNLGIMFAPEGSAGGSEEEMEEAMQEALRAPAHKVELYGMDILVSINNSNSIKDFMPKRWKDCIIGRHAATHITVSQGRIIYEPVHPSRLIFDRDDNDDDYNRYSLFKGFVVWKTKEEIMQAYSLDEKAKEELNRIFASRTNSMMPGVGGALGGHGYYRGFNWLDTEGTRRVACVTGYFVASITDEGEGYNTLYQGTLIGNNLLVDFGEASNISYDLARPEWPVIPIHVYSPDTVLGSNVSPVDRFRQIQSDCDALRLKIMETVSTALGKTYVFYSDVAQPKDIIEDLKNFKITVVNRADPEEPIINNNKLVDMVDMTLDPNIENYVRLRKELRQDMKDVVSQSSITQGIQQTYIGGGTQQATIAQAGNGTVALMSGFFQHFAFIQQHTLDIAKTMMLEAKNEEEADLIFSVASKEFWRSIQDLGVPDLQVRIEMEDFIDEERRARYQQYALAMAQNAKETGFSMLDALNIESARTSKELYRKIKESLELKKREAERLRQQEMGERQQQFQQTQQMQGQIFQLEEQGKQMRDQIRNIPKLEQNQIEREKLNLEREMTFKTEAGMPGTEVGG